MNFTLDIPSICLYLLGAMFLFGLAGAVVGMRHIRKVARAGRRFPTDMPDDGKLPGISVVVYAHNAEEHIADFLNCLLQQNHPDFEIIVVNDASIDNTAEIVENMMAAEPRIYLTFVSDTARNISRQKLAFTLGLRAAKKPVALLTASNIIIPDENWLRNMAAPFADKNIEVGIGAAYTPVETDRGIGRFWRSFDTLTSDTRWLGAALCHRPYRGKIYNLAIRPETFIKNKGFAATNRFQAGEDDIFINRIAKPGNTAVIFRPDAMPGIAFPPEEYPRLWKRSKERYNFTSHYLHTGALRTQGFLSLCVWGIIGCGIAASIVALPNLLPACVAALSLILFWAYQICVYRRAATAMRTIRLWWSVPFLWLARPVINAFYRAGFQANKHTNYTWQQPH